MVSEDIRSEIQNWKNNPQFAELCATVEAALEFKQSLSNSNNSSVGLTKLDDIILKAEKLFQAKKEGCLASNKYAFWMLLGLTYRLSPKFNDKCIEALGKAIKFKWDVHFLWNEIGELYWETGKKQLAKTCFERALDVERNPCSLRNLSVVVRNTGEKTSQAVEDGIQFANEAVELNADDRDSWTVLGNAYLTAYLFFNHDKKYAEKSLEAFRTAERLGENLNTIDLYHNMAVILKCQEKYSEALEKVERCIKIDGTWSSALILRQGLVAFITGIQQALDKCKPSVQKTEKLSKVPTVIAWKHSSEKKHQPFIVTPLKDLNEGSNTGLNVFGQIYWTVVVDDSFPLVVGLVDPDGETTTVHIFNVKSHGKFNDGDTLVIRNPYFEKVSFKYNDETIAFSAVKVADPSTVALNGKSLSPMDVRPLVASSTVL